MDEINKPLIPTYWIAYNNDRAFYHTGKTDSNQVTSTNLDNLDVYTLYSLYQAACDTLAILAVEE